METLLMLFLGGMCVAPFIGVVIGLFVGGADELDDWSTKRRAKSKKRKAKRRQSKDSPKDSGWWVIFHG